MGGAMGAPAAEAVPAVAPAISAAAPSAGSVAGSSMQDALNKLPEAYRGPSYGAEAGNVSLPSLVSTAPAQVAQAAAAATPAAQAAQQAAALDSMSMGQRFDALKAGATGTNALNYIKANPFTSLGVATAAMTPDENNTPQKAADTDRGPRAGMRFYPGYGTSLPAPNMQGIEQTYNRPYYAAKGGVTRMATGGITSAPRNQQQLFADYLQRVSSSGAATTTPPTNKYEWWKNPNDPAPAAPAPAETAEEYAARMRLNARGGGGGRGDREPEDPNSFSAQWAAMNDAEKEAYRLENPKTALAQDAVMLLASPLKFAYDKLQAYMGPDSSTGGPARYTPAAPDATPSEIAMRANPMGLDPAQQAVDPYGNFADAPLSSRTDVSGYPLRESELRSFERGLAPAPAPAPVTSAPIEGGDVPGAVPLNTSRIMASAKLAGDKPITDSIQTYSPFDAVNQYGKDEGNVTKNQIGALITQQESTARDYINAGQTLGFEHPTTVALKESYDSLNNLINAGYNRVLGEQPAAETDKARIDAMIAGLPDARQVTPSDMGAVTTALNRSYDLNNPNTNTYGGGFNDVGASTALNPFPGLASDKMSIAGKNVGTYTPVQGAYLPDVPGAISADTDDTTLSQFTNALYGGIAPPGYVGDATQLAGVGYTGGIPDATAGVPAPNMGNTGSIRGSYGIGGVWTNKEGMPIRTGDGSLVMTGAGAEAMQRAVAESNAAANRTYGNAPEGRTGRDATAGDGYGGGYGSVAAGYTGGSEAAAGGLSTPYGFQHMAQGGVSNPYDLGSYSDGGRLLKGPGDGVSDSIPATIGKGRPARLADGEFVIPARIVSEIGNGSTEAGARKLYAMMDRVQAGRKKSVGKGKVAVNSRADKYLPA
jgi:hypothetical protein